MFISQTVHNVIMKKQENSTFLQNGKHMVDPVVNTECFGTQCSPVALLIGLISIIVTLLFSSHQHLINLQLYSATTSVFKFNFI